MALILPASRDEWLKLRHSHISSTESAALFGMSPYQTAFELAVVKKSAEPPPDYVQDERMSWGLRLQRAIAEAIASDYGVKVRQLNSYASLMPQHRMGSSFDFEIVGIKPDHQSSAQILREMYSEHGPGMLEIKNVDAWIFKQQWEEVDGEYEAPSHIEIQVQHQLDCIDREWASIGVLVGGNRQILITRNRDRAVGSAIREKVRGFFDELDRGVMPPVSLPEDASAIRQLYGYAEPNKVLDYQQEDNQDIHKLVRDHIEATRFKSEAEKVHQSTGAALLMAIGDAEKVLFKDASVSAGMIAPTRVEAFDKKGYRNLRVYPRKEKTK